MLQSLWRHKRMFFNPQYGGLGLMAFPYFVIFEAFGPFIEVLGYIAVILSWALGLLNTTFFLLFLAVAILYGIFLSIAAILLEEISFRRYPSWEDLLKLLLFGILENLFYRQALAVFKVKAFWDFLRRKRQWGRMDRAGFKKETPPASSRAPASR
jgi:hypothetical protein